MLKSCCNRLVSFSFTLDRKSTRLNSSHSQISYAVFCLKKKNAPFHSDPRARRRSPFHREAPPPAACSRGAPCSPPSGRFAPQQCRQLDLFFFNDAAPPETSPLPHPGAFRI